MELDSPVTYVPINRDFVSIELPLKAVSLCPQDSDINAGQLPENIPKNRYKDILPYEVCTLLFTCLFVYLFDYHFYEALYVNAYLLSAYHFVCLFVVLLGD